MSTSSSAEENVGKIMDKEVSVIISIREAFHWKHKFKLDVYHKARQLSQLISPD